MNAELFKKDVEKAVRKAISSLERGTVGIGEDCLWQLAAGHLSRSANGPTGTNAAYVARQVFNEIVRVKPYAGFVYQQ